MRQNVGQKGVPGSFMCSGEWPEPMDVAGVSADDLPASGTLKACLSLSLLILASADKGLIFRDLHMAGYLNSA